MSLDYSVESITGLNPLKTYYYRIGTGNYTAIPANSSVFSVASLLTTTDQLLYLREGTSGVPYAVPLLARPAAPDQPLIDFPQAGHAVIQVDSDYEYRYDNGTVTAEWTACTNSGIDIEWTHDLNKKGSRAVYIRLKGNASVPASAARGIGVSRMMDSITWDSGRGNINFVGETVNSPRYSINGKPWVEVNASYCENITINKYELDSGSNVVRVKYGSVDTCAYAEIAIMVSDSGVSDLPELIYVEPDFDQDKPNSYNPFTGTLQTESDTAYFKFNVDQSRTNAGFIVLKDQPMMRTPIKFYSLDGTQVSFSLSTTGSTYYVYSVPANIPDGEYYAMIQTDISHLYDYATNFKVLYTSLDKLSNFTSGINTLVNLDRHEANTSNNAVLSIKLANMDIEHWYKVYLSSSSIFRNCITINTYYSRVEFTIRPINAPNNVIYSSSANASTTRRTRCLSSYGTVTKTSDYRPPSSNYYYLVVKAEQPVYNEPYGLMVGDPVISEDSETFNASSSITLSTLNAYTTVNINVPQIGTLRETAVVNRIRAQGSSANGFAEIGLKKSTESTYHDGTYLWDYYYTTTWKSGLIPAAGTWAYRARITSSTYLPKTFTPTFQLYYYYELGD